MVQGSKHKTNIHAYRKHQPSNNCEHKHTQTPARSRRHAQQRVAMKAKCSINKFASSIVSFLWLSANIKERPGQEPHCRVGRLARGVSKRPHAGSAAKQEGRRHRAWSLSNHSSSILHITASFFRDFFFHPDIHKMKKAKLRKNNNIHIFCFMGNHIHFILFPLISFFFFCTIFIIAGVLETNHLFSMPFSTLNMFFTALLYVNLIVHVALWLMLYVVVVCWSGEKKLLLLLFLLYY